MKHTYSINFSDGCKTFETLKSAVKELYSFMRWHARYIDGNISPIYIITRNMYSDNYPVVSLSYNSHTRTFYLVTADIDRNYINGIFL